MFASEATYSLQTEDNESNAYRTNMPMDKSCIARIDIICIYQGCHLIGQRHVVRVRHSEVEVGEQGVEGVSHHHDCAVGEEPHVARPLRIVGLNDPYR